MDDDLEQFPHADTKRFIRIKARQLAGRYGYLHDEFEDIQQSLMLECIKRLPHFDPKRGNRGCFISAIVNHAIANLIEQRRAQRRGYYLCHVPLDASGSGSYTVPLADVISDASYRDQVGISSRPSDQTLQLQIDVERAIDGLPSDLQRICRVVMVLDGFVEVATAMGVSRATLHRRMLAIRAEFSRIGLYKICRQRRLYGKET